MMHGADKKHLLTGVGTSDKPDSKGCTQYPWDTADGSRWTDEEGSIFDGRSARCLARCVNRGYVTGCHTATFQWHLISSFVSTATIAQLYYIRPNRVLPLSLSPPLSLCMAQHR